MSNSAIFLEPGVKITKGRKQVVKGLAEKKFKKVLIASDDDSSFRDEIIEKCRLNGTVFEICLTKAELGKACGIDVPCGVAGIEYEEN